MLSKIFRSRKSKAKLFYYIDPFLPKNKYKSLFVVKNKTFFSGNLRVLLETYVKESSDTLYIYKDGKLSTKLKEELIALNVIVLHGFTLRTIWHILTSSTILLSHNPRDAHLTRHSKHRKIINLWHGVALKQIELLMPNIPEVKFSLLQNNAKLYDMLIASSKIDQATNAKAFGISVNKIALCGLPRYEILKHNYQMGTVLKDENNKILKIKGNKKLILFAPTFRENTQSPIKQITTKEWQKLKIFVEKSDIIFGIRPHPYDVTSLHIEIKNHPNFYLFDNLVFTEANILLKHSDILIVDFSSIWIDYLLLHRPILGFAKDYIHYLENERGFIYDFHTIFPNTFSTDINQLIETITKTLNQSPNIIYKKALTMFHEHSLDYPYVKKLYKSIEKVNL